MFLVQEEMISENIVYIYMYKSKTKHQLYKTFMVIRPEKIKYSEQ